MQISKNKRQTMKKISGGAFAQDEEDQLRQMGFTNEEIDTLNNSNISLDIVNQAIEYYHNNSFHIIVGIAQQLNENAMQNNNEQNNNNLMIESNPTPQPPVKVKSAWFNGSFYLFVASIVFGGISFFGKQMSLPVLFLAILGTALLTLIIGFLQLKEDARLKDKTFLALMKMVIGSLPLI